MIRDIIRDVIFLAQPSALATAADWTVADDLSDTLRANRERCVGMAANMIGVAKCIIVFENQGTLMEMFNPEILKGDGRYSAEEGCLSLEGTRPTQRYKTIKVRWQNRDMQTRVKNFSGWTAQIIQHEIDHCRGIII